MLYMVTFTINIPQMLAYIPAPWILWVINHHYVLIIALKGICPDDRPSKDCHGPRS